MDLTQAAKFLTAYYHDIPQGQLVELTCIHPDKESRHELHVHWWKPPHANRDILDLLAHYNDRDGYGIYVAACPRKSMAPRGRRGSVADVDTVVSFYAELDSVKDGRSVADDMAALEDSELPPSVMVKSGGGVHAYWLLDKPHTFAEDEKPLAKSVLRELRRRYNGDPQAAELARVLRLPGFANTKPERGNALVEMVLPKQKHRYTWEQMIALIPPEPARPRRNYDPKNATEEDVVRALDALAPYRCDDREDWLLVTIAVKAALGDAGYSAWDAWSARSSHYNAEGNRRTWDTLDQAGKTTVGTLFYYANQDNPDWRPKRARKPPVRKIEDLQDIADLTNAQERAILSYSGAGGPSVCKFIKAALQTFKVGETFTLKQLADSANLTYRTMCRALFQYNGSALLDIRTVFEPHTSIDSDLVNKDSAKTVLKDDCAGKRPILCVRPSSQELSQRLLDEIIIPAELRKTNTASEDERRRSRMRIARWHKALSDPTITPVTVVDWKDDYRAYVASKNATLHFGEHQSAQQAFWATGLRRETLRRAEARLELIHRETYSPDVRKIERVSELPRPGQYDANRKGVATWIVDSNGEMVGNYYSAYVQAKVNTLLSEGNCIYVKYLQSPVLTYMDEQELRDWESEQLRREEKRKFEALRRKQLGIKSKPRPVSTRVIGWDAETEARLVRQELKFKLTVTPDMSLAERTLRLLSYTGTESTPPDPLVEGLMKHGGRVVSIEYDEETALEAA